MSSITIPNVRFAFAPEEVADAAAKNALTIVGAQVGRRLVRLADTGVVYIAAAVGTGADKWIQFRTDVAATDAVAGVVELATPAEVTTGTDTVRAVTPGGFASGIAALTASRQAAQGLVSDGTLGSLLVIPAIGVTDVSVSGRFRTTTTGGYIMASAANGIAISIAGGKLSVGKTGVATLIESTTTVTDGNVHTFVWTRSGVTEKIYLDGRLDATATDGATVDFTGAVERLGIRTASANAFTGSLALIGVLNRALSAAEVLTLASTGQVAGEEVNSASNTSLLVGDNSTFASNTGFWTLYGAATIAAGKLTLPDGSFAVTATMRISPGRKYRFTVTVDSLTAGNAQYYSGTGYVNFASAAGTYTVEFTALADSGFTLKCDGGIGVLDTALFYNVGALWLPDFVGYRGGPQVMDTSGNGADVNLPGDGVSGGVTPAILGAEPSPFRYTRTSNGYLIGDQRVIPPGCSVLVYAKGNGTFSLGDSAGSPATIVDAQTAPTVLSPIIVQAGYVTATFKLYLTLGTATTVTVLIKFIAV